MTSAATTPSRGREQAPRRRPRLRPSRVRGDPAGRYRLLQPDLRHRRDRQLACVHRQRALRVRQPAHLGQDHAHPRRAAAAGSGRGDGGQPAGPLVRRARARAERHRPDVLPPGLPVLVADHHRHGHRRLVGALRLRQPREPWPPRPRCASRERRRQPYSPTAAINDGPDRRPSCASPEI
jgi:hypothetical protein